MPKAPFPIPYLTPILANIFGVFPLDGSLMLGSADSEDPG